jgi:RNA polymerase sigma-70 factor (ECF subfamily)
LTDEESRPSSPAHQRFYELVWPHRATVLRVAKLLVGDDAEAEDLAQETLLKAFGAIDSHRKGSDVRAWLLSILRNLRVDRHRKTKRSSGTLSLDGHALVDHGDGGLISPEQPADAWSDPAEIMEAFSDQQIIDALRRLPEDIRLTLLLVDVEQLDHSDAAVVLGVAVGTIKSRTHRGRAMLRDALAPIAREMGLLPR